ncbi:MAG: porin [Phycisphaerales bacterium]|nr:porin [Phycisphaerales bacterium]
MNASRFIGLAMAGVVTPMLLADDGDALRARIADLEAQQSQTNALLGALQGDLDLVQAETSDTWLSEARAEEIRGIVQDVLADADTRASLQGNGATSGYDKGFFIASADGKFKLTMNANLQFRFAWNHRDQPITTPTESDLFGFSNQRTALIFKGHAFDPSLTYFVQAMYGANYNGALMDAWIGKSFDGGWKLRAGKFREPFMRETLVGYTQQLAVDRSLMQYYMGIGRSQGLELSNKGDNFRFSAAAFEAFDTIAGTPALGPIGNTYDSIAFAARAEYLAMGSWGDVKNYTAFAPAEASLLIGGAVAYATTDQQLVGGTGQQHDLRWTGDVTYNFDGGSIAAAVVMANINEDPFGLARERDSVWGFNVQGGFFLDEDLQAFARYEWADSMYAGDDDMSIVQAGVNYYMHGQNVKWSSDIGYSFNQLPATYFSVVQGGLGNGGTNLTGWTADAGDGQWLIRSQVQLCF